METKPLQERQKVVSGIAKGTARYIAARAIEESPDILDAIDVMHDVVRHLMSKIGAERRTGDRRK